jgi:gamma-glutamyltranspeptidase
MSSGIGGGAFIVVRNASSGEAVAFDARETAILGLQEFATLGLRRCFLRRLVLLL